MFDSFSLSLSLSLCRRCTRLVYYIDFCCSSSCCKCCKRCTKISWLVHYSNHSRLRFSSNFSCIKSQSLKWIFISIQFSSVFCCLLTGSKQLPKGQGPRCAPTGGKGEAAHWLPVMQSASCYQRFIELINQFVNTAKGINSNINQMRTNSIAAAEAQAEPSIYLG